MEGGWLVLQRAVLEQVPKSIDSIAASGPVSDDSAIISVYMLQHVVPDAPFQRRVISCSSLIGRWRQRRRDSR